MKLLQIILRLKIQQKLWKI